MYQTSDENRYWVSEKPQKPSWHLLYRNYRRMGLRPFNAYASLLSISGISKEERLRRLQRAANWMNKNQRAI